MTDLPAVPQADPAAVEASIRQWVERAVIGLGLCPFAAPVVARDAVRYVVSAASTDEELVEDLIRELETLAEASPARLETTLLIVPNRFADDFLAFNDFLDVVDGVLAERDLEGEIQVASFHPQFQFADAGPDDIDNFTNRAPWPVLHLLRESSVEAATDGDEEAAARIVERNVVTMRELGHAGWAALWAGPLAAARSPHRNPDKDQ